MRFVARRPYFKLLDVVDEELLESPGQHVLCLLLRCPGLCCVPDSGQIVFGCEAPVCEEGWGCPDGCPP